MSRIAIVVIAAMQREVGPLIRGWKVRKMEHGGRQYRLFENGEAALVCGGIGAEAARRATEAIICEVNPVRVISVGFAGALAGTLDRSLQVGQVLQPRTVINAADGARTEVDSGSGVLVSSASVADKEQKVRLGKAYGAIAVDMEAAAVAQGARARGVEFGALKAISDAADFSLPAIDGFVADDGTFRYVRFGCHVALHPWLLGTTIALARNSSKASRALCGAIESYLADYLADYPGRETYSRQTLPGESLSGESKVPDLNPTDVSQTENGTCAGAHTHTGAQLHTRATEKR